MQDRTIQTVDAGHRKSPLSGGPALLKKLTLAAAAAGLSLLPLACATVTTLQGPSQGTVESALVEAGFVRHEADTPQRMGRIRSEVQRRVVPVEEDGKTYYIYADADFCRCLYVGDEAAFARFEDLIRKRDIERSSCIDDRLRSVQSEPWREFGSLGDLCRGTP